MTSRFFLLLLCFTISFFAHSDNKKENWLMGYSFANGKELPNLYLEFTVDNNKISGIANDGSRNIAELAGNREDNNYRFIFHPYDMSDDQSQNMVFHGFRTENQIFGKWQHTNGVYGQWGALLTQLPAQEAFQQYQ